VTLEGEATTSPDGQFIAFASDRDGDFEIFTKRPDESPVGQVTDDPASDTEPAWSPRP